MCRLVMWQRITYSCALHLISSIYQLPITPYRNDVGFGSVCYFFRKISFFSKKIKKLNWTSGQTTLLRCSECKTATNATQNCMRRCCKVVGSSIKKFSLMLMFFLLGLSAHAQEQTIYSIDLPAQMVSESLIDLSEQIDVLLLFSYDVAKDLKANSVKGNFTLPQALEMMLEGTGYFGGLSKKGVLMISLEKSDGAVNKRKTSEKTSMRENENSNSIGRSALGGGRTSMFSAISAAVLTLFNSTGTYAQDEGNPSLELEEIIVIGSREANRRAIAVKNEYTQIMDALSADDVGSLPDINIADAFRRLPGVNTLFDTDEGKFVTVRGIAPELNLVTIDGVSIGSSDENSGKVNLEALPANSVSGLEVFKTQMPQFDGNAIGGTLNMVTRSAYDHDGMYLQVDAEASKYSYDSVPGDNKLGGTFGFGYSDVFGEYDQFGVVIAAGYLKKDRDGTNTLTKDAFDGDYPVPFQKDTYSRSQTNVWERTSVSAKFEYQPNEELYMSLNNYYYNMEEDETIYLHGLYRQTSNNNDNPDLDSATDYVNSVSPQGRFEHNINQKEEETTTSGHHFHVDYNPGEMHRFSADIAATTSSFRFPNQELKFRTRTNVVDDAAILNALGFSLNRDSFYPTIEINDPSAILNPNNYNHNGNKTELKALDEDRTEVKFDYAYNADSHSLGWGAMAGFKYRTMERDFDRNQTQYNGTDLTLASFVDESINFTPWAPNVPVLIADFDAFQNYFNSNMEDFTESSNNLKDSTERDYVLTRDVTAVYVGGRYATEDLTVVAGVRYEETDFSSDGVFFDNDADKNDPSSYTRAKNSNSYSDILPSINVTYRLTDQLILRSAFSKSLGRPDPGDIKARNKRDEKDTVVEITRGAPDLKPRRSDNYDLSLEYYFDEGDSLLSAALFHKNIDDMIISINDETEEIDPETGYPITYKQKTNANTSEVTGLELAAIKNSLDFDFMPDILRNFGMSANATFLDAEMNYEYQGVDYSIDHLQSQPDFIANFSLFYAFGDSGEVRVAYNYTDDYATNLKTKGDDDQRGEHVYQAYEQVDLQARYNVTDHLIIRAKVRNLANHSREEHTAFENYPFYRLEYGRSYWLGMSYQF
jgi:iron complex outermembrane recepter protein